MFDDFGKSAPKLVIFGFLPVAVSGAVAELNMLGENVSVRSADGCLASLGRIVRSGMIRWTQIAEARDREAMRCKILIGEGRGST